jgi:predicted ATP-binding protein involved in virulence
MKIRKLHIKNYKVFDDIELDFTDANGKTLDKIVLAGVNGCGKTTVLEIIRKFFSRDLKIEDEQTSIVFEFEISTVENQRLRELLSPILIAINNSVNDIPKYIDSNDSLKTFLDKLSNSKNLFLLSFSSNPKPSDYSLLLYDNSFTPLFYLPVNDTSNKVGNLSIIHLDSDKDKMKTFTLKKIRDEVFKNEDIAPRQSKEKAIKRITKALEGLNLTTKLVDLESEELIFESPNGEKIKFEDLSSGEQNLYFRAIYLSTINPQNSIIMIDEPEDSLHPTWQQKVMQLYQNIGENNQVIVATHSPHIIGSSKAEEVFLLQIDAHQIEARHPKYTKGHSIDYVLDEIMGANSRDTSVINLVDSYLALMRKGLHESEEGMKIKANIEALNLDPNSEEMRGLNLSIKRIKAVGV